MIVTFGSDSSNLDERSSTHEVAYDIQMTPVDSKSALAAPADGGKAGSEGDREDFPPKTSPGNGQY